MSIVDDIIPLLASATSAASAGIMSTVVSAARRTCLMISLLVIATAFLLGAAGLMIAALIIGLAPHVGTHWAAMIAAGAALMASAILVVIAMRQ
jgi:hypothetical protein